MNITKAWAVDTAERVGSTVAEAGLGWLTTYLTHLPTIYTVLFAGGLAVLKAQLAKIATGTVSPASLAPAQQPEQALEQAPPPVADLTLTVHDRLALLPPSAGRKGGALPSPVDARDWQAKLPRLSTIPATCDFGAGIGFAMLLNDRIGDCYPAALLHALQVLTGGKFSPTDADVLHVYEQVTGYDPTRTQPDGSNPTDNGTYGRQLFDWARTHGLIKSYAAVPANRASVRAAIAAHKAVLCEWALPIGAEREGDVWTMPRSGRTAGSWGGHATVEVGYTKTRNRNVTWGEEGTVTEAFEDAYLVAAWVIEAPTVIPAMAMCDVTNPRRIGSPRARGAHVVQGLRPEVARHAVRQGRRLGRRGFDLHHELPELRRDRHNDRVMGGRRRHLATALQGSTRDDGPGPRGTAGSADPCPRHACVGRADRSADRGHSPRRCGSVATASARQTPRVRRRCHLCLDWRFGRVLRLQDAGSDGTGTAGRSDPCGCATSSADRAGAGARVSACARTSEDRAPSAAVGRGMQLRQWEALQAVLRGALTTVGAAL